MVAIKHGTSAGYQRERLYGYDPCEACVAAYAEYHRNYQKTYTMSEQTKAGVRAYRRALTRLAQQFQEEFRVLENEERAKEPELRGAS